MASLQQLASILADRAGKKTDYSFVKQMKDLVVITRARIIANSLSKNPALDKFYLQRFQIELEPKDITDECNEDLPDDCKDKVFKSVETIPEPIRYGVHPFNYVGSPGGHKSFGWTTFGTEAYLKTRKMTGSYPRHTYLNASIYVFNKEMEFIDVEGVFADPRSVAKFKACNGAPSCYSDEQEFPIDEQNAEIILKEITIALRAGNLPDEPIQVKVDKDV